MNKADARYQRSRAAIVESSIQLLLSNPDAGMSEIAIAAGVGRATLYRHFETREQLIKEITLVCLQETDQALLPLKSEAVQGMAAIAASIDAIVPLADRFRFLMSLSSTLTHDKEVARVYKRQLKELVTYIEDAKAAGDIPKSIPTDWVVACYDALLNAAWSQVQEGKLSSKKVSKLLKESFIASLQRT